MTQPTWVRLGGITDGGDIGGDIQATDAFNIRYHHATKETALTNVGFYGVLIGGRYMVEIQTEWMVCRDRSDPGGTEIWADYRYVYADGERSYDTAAEAAKRARVLAECHTFQSITWDGNPPWGDES